MITGAQNFGLDTTRICHRYLGSAYVLHGSMWLKIYFLGYWNEARFTNASWRKPWCKYCSIARLRHGTRVALLASAVPGVPAVFHVAVPRCLLLVAARRAVRFFNLCCGYFIASGEAAAVQVTDINDKCILRFETWFFLGSQWKTPRSRINRAVRARIYYAVPCLSPFHSNALN